MSVQLVKKALSDTLRREKRNKTKKKVKTQDIDKYLDTWMISFSDEESCDHKKIKTITNSGSYNESRDKKSQQPHSQGQYDYYQKCKKLRSKVLKKVCKNDWIFLNEMTLYFV